MKKLLSAILAVFMTLFSTDAKEFPKITETVFSVETETQAVRNPHKGWVQYVYDSAIFEDSVYGVEADPAWDMVSVVYSRFFWKDIETSKGVYDWSSIDEMIELCDKYDMTFAFGIVPADSLVSDEDGFVPEYVYNNGCKYVDAKTENGVQRTPVWDDKQYLAASYNLAAAIAQRYDGDDRIEFIDIRTFGNWGEWHISGLTGSTFPSESVQKECLNRWAKLFDDTMLVLPVNADKPTTVSKYAVKLGITLRRDGLVQTKGAENALVTATDANFPAVGETLRGYTDPRDDGTWSDEELITAVEGGKVTYMALAGSVWDGHEFYADKKELLESLSGKIGYNYTVTEAVLKTNGISSTVTLKIKNTGCAPAYFPIDIRLAITDKDGNAMKILPGHYLYESGSFGSDTTETLTFIFENSLLTEESFLAVGAFEGSYEEDSDPDVRFANKSTAENGYLLLEANSRKQ